MGEDEEIIWYKDLSGLMNSMERIYSFIPIYDSSLASQLNALFRFSIYYGLIIFIFQMSFKAIFLPLIVGGISYLVYEHEKSSLRIERNSLDAQGLHKDPQTGSVCTKPTIDNPFMNVLYTDYSTRPNREKACDISRPSVSKHVDALYEQKFPNSRYSNDIFGKNTGMRQFYSNPSTTIPNDQGTFAKWLYNDRSLKEAKKDMS